MQNLPDQIKFQDLSFSRVVSEDDHDFSVVRFIAEKLGLRSEYTGRSITIFLGELTIEAFPYEAKNSYLISKASGSVRSDEVLKTKECMSISIRKGTQNLGSTYSEKPDDRVGTARMFYSAVVELSHSKLSKKYLDSLSYELKSIGKVSSSLILRDS